MFDVGVLYKDEKLLYKRVPTLSSAIGQARMIQSLGNRLGTTNSLIYIEFDEKRLTYQYDADIEHAAKEWDEV